MMQKAKFFLENQCANLTSGRNMGSRNKAQDPGRAISVGEMVDKRWQIVRLLGEGGFGAVYEVRDANEPKGSQQRYAMKVESSKAPPNEQVLKMDVSILQRLRHRPSPHFVELYSVGATDRFHFMVTSLAGTNLHDLKRKQGGKFKPRTVAHIAINTLLGLQAMHEINHLHLHRDLKPPNMAIGVPPDGLRRVFLLDFGLSRQYRRDENGQIRRPRKSVGFRGTLRYAPLCSHKKEEASRADDLWMWLFVMIEFVAGNVPWNTEMSKVRELPKKEQHKRIGKVKEQMLQNPLELLHGCPQEFMELHNHLYVLHYYSDPDYELMRNALVRLEERRKRPDKDGEKLDWEPKR